MTRVLTIENFTVTAAPVAPLATITQTFGEIVIFLCAEVNIWIARIEPIESQLFTVEGLIVFRDHLLRRLADGVQAKEKGMEPPLRLMDYYVARRSSPTSASRT